MVSKLEEPVHAGAFALQGAHLFAPGGSGRPFTAWVLLPPEQASLWPDLTAKALA